MVARDDHIVPRECKGAQKQDKSNSSHFSRWSRNQLRELCFENNKERDAGLRERRIRVRCQWMCKLDPRNGNYKKVRRS